MCIHIYPTYIQLFIETTLFVYIYIYICINIGNLSHCAHTRTHTENINTNMLSPYVIYRYNGKDSTFCLHLPQAHKAPFLNNLAITLKTKSLAHGD